MKTIGQVIRSYRERHNYSVEKLAKVTSIEARYIQAFEQEMYQDLPAGPLVQGYVQLIAHILKIPEETANALYRRDIAPIKKKTPLQKKLQDYVPYTKRGKRMRYLQPQVISVLVVGVLLLIASSILGWYWWQLDQPPALVINQPENGEVVTSPVIVQGNSHPDSSVNINTTPVTLDTNGNFSYELVLPPGERALVITARNTRGLQAEKVLFIEVDPPTNTQ